MFKYFNEDVLSYRNGVSATVTIGNWIMLMLVSFLSFIPLVGFLAVIVAYLVIAFRKETAPSISNYIKANLIISAIALVLGIIICVLIIGSVGALGSVIGI